MKLEEKNSSQLKKPTIIRLLSAGFLVSPFFNMATALYMAGFSTWYSPKSWLSLFSHLPATEQSLNGLIMLAGVLLIFQRKSSWSVAVLILVGVSAYNILSTLTQGGKFHFLSSFNLLVNMGVLVVFYFFRYPYLDQRDHILAGLDKRYPTNFSIKVNQIFTGQMKNISNSGCFITLEISDPSFAVGQEIGIQIESTEFYLNGKIIYIKGGLGINFITLSPENKVIIQKLIELSAK